MRLGGQVAIWEYRGFGGVEGNSRQIQWARASRSGFFDDMEVDHRG